MRKAILFALLLAPSAESRAQFVVDNHVLLKDRFGIEVRVHRAEGKAAFSSPPVVEIDCGGAKNFSTDQDLRVSIKPSKTELFANYVAKFSLPIRDLESAAEGRGAFVGLSFAVAEKLLESTYVVFDTAEGRVCVVDVGKLVAKQRKLESLSGRRPEGEQPEAGGDRLP